MRSQKQKNRRLTLLLVCGVLLMFGFCYLMIPFYQLICKTEGINGKTAATPSPWNPQTQVDATRNIRVDFTTTLHGALQFKFTPLESRITIHPGERRLVYFYAENQTGKEITVQAIPSITPNDAARFLKKTECFCFTQQYFFKGEKAKMPVYFFIEPGISKEIKEVTLSYTLFDATPFKKGETKREGRIDL